MAGDFQGYFKGLQEGGYATDPAYAAKLAGVHAALATALV
jgi:flagellum-specific peptidoglycan hydrolase FlgJ